MKTAAVVVLLIASYALGLLLFQANYEEPPQTEKPARVVEILHEAGVYIVSIDGHLYAAMGFPSSLTHLESCPEDHR